jgi:hypothetical protein
MPELNWLAIIVAAVPVFVLSSVYYIVLSDQYAQVSEAAARSATEGGRPPASTLVLEFLRTLILSTMVAGLVSVIGVTDVGGALVLALVLWTGAMLHEDSPLKLAAIHAGDWLLKLVVIAVIVTIWR